MARVTVASRFLRRSRKSGVTPWHIASLVAGALAVWAVYFVHTHYTFSWQTPVRVHVQSPLVVSRRAETSVADDARFDQHRSLNAYQQYTCRKFGAACRVALAIQR